MNKNIALTCAGINGEEPLRIAGGDLISYTLAEVLISVSRLYLQHHRARRAVFLYGGIIDRQLTERDVIVLI